MAYRVRTVRDLDEFIAAIGAIGHYFGWQPTAEDAERFSKILPFERMHAVFDDGRIVAGAGAYPLELTLPGRPGAVRRRDRRGRPSVAPAPRPSPADDGGAAADVRERGEPVAALWASEETIYGRFGYGLASLGLHVEAKRRCPHPARAASRGRLPADRPRRGAARAATALRPDPQADAGLRLALDRTGGRLVGSAIGPRAAAGPGRSSARSTSATERRRATRSTGSRRTGRRSPSGRRPSASSRSWGSTRRRGATSGASSSRSTGPTRSGPSSFPSTSRCLLLVDKLNELGLRVYDGLWVRAVDVPAALAARVPSRTAAPRSR